ncbi:MAG: ABC transporter substrate-binding protein [Nitrososphaerales archaeon]|nr:ABC transporter substrate-binding protein [Nitrososphaerales archaeon]
MRTIQKVVVYGSLGIRPGLSELLWAFRKRNKLEEFPVYLDDHPFQLLERIEREQSNGMRTADVVLMPHYMLLTLAKSGMLARHRPAEPLPSGLADAEHRFSPIGVTFMGMACDSRTLSSNRLPSRIEDLLEPKRYKLGVQSLTASKAGNLGVYYVAYLRHKLGESRWRSFVEGLADRNVPKAYDCIDHLLQGMMDGELSVALTVYSLAYFREKVIGSPVELLRMEDAPTMLTFTSAGLLRGAEENPSAVTFFEFLLSEEAQRIIGSMPGIAPVRPGLRPAYDFQQEYGPESEFHPNEKEMEEAGRAADFFRRLGLP